jgi:hypothetical protein
MPENQSVFRWSAYEHEHIERGRDWYLALGIAAVCIAITAVLFQDTLFGVIILLAASTIGLNASRAPQLVQFELSERGIRIGEKLHRFEEILAFWVEDEHASPPLLLIDTPQVMAPNLIIPLENIDPQVIRAFLVERTEEVPMREPLSHKILEFIGF